MKKRLALLGLAIIFILGSVLGGALGPLLSGIVSQATASGGGDPLHKAGVANYRIENLPRRSHQVGDIVPVDQPNVSTGVFYTISRRVSNRDILMGVSHSTVGTMKLVNGVPTLTRGDGDKYVLDTNDPMHPGIGTSRLIGHPNGFNTFTLEGTYTYHFYGKDEYEELELGTLSGMVVASDDARSFHTYTITVYSTNFRIELPTNDWSGMLPNVIIPSSREALRPIGDPLRAQPVSELTLPLPQSLFDMRGRDLLANPSDRENTDAIEARRDAYKTDPRVSNISDMSQQTCEDIIALIYADMTITFFGNPAGATRRPDSALPFDFTIEDPSQRTFIPVVDGGWYYAEYAYFNSYNNIRSSFRTENINVELPSDLPAGIIPGSPRILDHIRLETIPSMSFTPSDGSFRLGVEATLPTATVSVHSESEITFDSTHTLTNFTYVAVRYRPRGTNDRAWRWIGVDEDGNWVRSPTSATNPAPVIGLQNWGTIAQGRAEENDSRILRITDFKFTPEEIGDYQFWFYTTTIIGVGSVDHLTPAIEADRIHEFQGRLFFKNQPFDNITIERDSRAPEIRWTVDFDYNEDDDMNPWYGNTWWNKSGFGTTTNPADALINNETGLREVAVWGQRLVFADAPDRRQWLPGSTAASRTRIPMGSSLVIPALLGVDNATPSHLLDYHMFLHRYQDGIRSDDSIFWSSGLNRDDAQQNGGIWEHNRTFNIEFSEEAFRGTPVDPRAPSLLDFQGNLVTGRYDIRVLAFDEHNNISGQYQYTFEVVDPELWESNYRTRPRLQGLFRAGQNEYHEGDTLRFNVASFTDDSTDDRDIEVRYFLSFADESNRWGLDIENGTAFEIKDGEDGVTISGGLATFVLSRDNVLGEYILDELSRNWRAGETHPVQGVLNVGTAAHRAIIENEKRHDGFLTFRIYAVARNYHAITSGFQVGPERQGDQNQFLFTIANVSRPANNLAPDAKFFITAVFGSVTIFDMTYGAAAWITDEVSDGVGGLDHSWYVDETLEQDTEIAIPALRFYYPDDISKPQLYSTITYSVTFQGHTRDARSYNDLPNGGQRQVGGGWQGNIGKSDPEDTANHTNPATFGGRQIGGLFVKDGDDIVGYEDHPSFINQRYFMPMGVGVHYITVRVTNAGGNISVFVGTIMVQGVPQANSRLLGEPTTTMRIGESEKMPAVEITVNHKKFVTEHIISTSDGIPLSGHVVTAEGHVDNNDEPIIVGYFTVSFRSENGSAPAVHFNNFVPRAVDTYTFIYTIVMQDDETSDFPTYLQDTVGLKPDERITLEEEWRVVVENISEDDIMIDLDVLPYSDLATSNPHGRLGSFFDAGFAPGSDEFVSFYNPRNINVYNFFTPMLTDNAAGRLLEMSDTQLWGGMEPVVPDGVNEGNFIPDQWQYGRIFVPNWLPRLASEVDWLNEDFNCLDNGADSWVTVTKGTTVLLDTRPEHATSTTNLVEGGQGMEGNFGWWFRPTGRRVPQYLQDGNPVSASEVAPQNKNVEWAMRNAVNKHEATDDGRGWPYVPAAHGNFVQVDGEYIITYTIEYMLQTVTLTFQIAMGDTGAPRITLLDRSPGRDLFTRTYLVGQPFEFNTQDIEIRGIRNHHLFDWSRTGEEGEHNLLANSQRNPRFTITIMTDSGRPVTVGGDHDYTIRINNPENGFPDGDWSEIHRFYFREAGTYYITFSVTTPAGVTNSREYRIHVEERTPRPEIAPEEIWAYVLIVISIGLLLGVVIYFIRTGQQTKFASAKNKPKRRVKEKEEDDGDGGVV